jgi:hypothetical protein
MIYPDDYLKCDAGGACGAPAGDRCYDLLAAGPQALPSRYRDSPHSGRKVRGAVPATPAKPRPQSSGADVVTRRAARRTTTKATGWEAVAARQRERREARDGK